MYNRDVFSLSYCPSEQKVNLCDEQIRRWIEEIHTLPNSQHSLTSLCCQAKVM